MEGHRNRAAGWKHAKLSGHENETKLEYLMQYDIATQEHFLSRIGKAGHTITHVKVGGLCEKDVPCVFTGEQTKSKTDMRIVLDDGSEYNVSIKKSLAGQVYLISADRFVRGYEAQYKTTIPDNVKRAIALYWGCTDEISNLIEVYGTQPAYEKRKHRLVANTLAKYDISLNLVLLDWFKNHMREITEFCFSRGLAANKSDWANVIWYKNELGENSIDQIFVINDLCDKMQSAAKTSTFYGKVGGGTTIQLPFGFVQWHSPTKKIPGDMQFHHKFKSISNSIEEK